MRSRAVQGPARGFDGAEGQWLMTLAQPEQGGLAAAGCSLSQPFPDNGIDRHVSHSTPGHTVHDEVTIKVQ